MDAGALGDVAGFHFTALSQQAQYAPLLFRQPVAGQHRSKVGHHRFAGAQQASNASGQFRLVGRDFPAPPQSGRAATLEVTIAGYQDVWIPSTGYDASLSFSGTPAASLEDVRYNAATGTAVLTTGLRKGQSYRLSAIEQRLPADAALEHTPTATIQMPPVSDIPDTVAAKATDITGSAKSPIDKLRTIEKYLKSNGFLSHGTASDQSPSRAG